MENTDQWLLGGGAKSLPTKVGSMKGFGGGRGGNGNVLCLDCPHSYMPF